MLKQFKRTAILILGIFFLLLGLVGLALPFLQGFLFLIIGILLVSVCIPEVGEWMKKYTRRYPKVHTQVEKVDAWLKGTIGEL